ncbi:unnamed protein product [Sphenostylis stenocarpa]|uniref:TIR domain-containing protein n=1 Tax=Sphenostylis stenocarpa TaxID=92480 RepID=A0AA86SVZ3_9FABA|nr:unnamed protein product [Sphenostylis stenocarpa]
MATPSSHAFTYDVFLSFRGEDTRYGFTGNLYKALRGRGIRTFIDDEALPSGEEITPALMKAIQESKIAITVLSQNYASSSFCLDELAAILDCKSKGLLVIPVFYNVNPSDVRHQKGSYGEALIMHEKRFKAEEKLQKWKMALHQVANFSGYHFQHGYEGLEEEEKSVFLDIACCFKGYALTEVEDMLLALYDDCMEHHIGVLVEKSLIKVSANMHSTVEMHDLIQDMGRQIDQKESPKEPGKRRRLWLPKDIIQVLKGKTGTSQIEIICLDFFISEKKETVEYNENTFMEMENLKILIVRNAKFSKGPNYLPEILKWFENLTILNFDHCELLTQIPDVSNLPNLEELSFEGCESLITVHDSVGFMDKLKILNAELCSNLKSFPNLNLTSLERLKLSFCSSLENFPEILGKMENIKKLDLYDLPVKELSNSFQNLSGLQEFYVECDVLQLSSIALTPELCDLIIGNCKGWQWLAQVTFLSLRKSNITFLPECLKEFHNMYHLDVSDCKKLQEIRGVPPNLKHFRAINCISLASSGSSMLLNQQLHEAGVEVTEFVFPGGSIPEWFDFQKRGPSISFWFRNEFPAKVLCYLIAPVLGALSHLVTPKVIINGVEEFRFGRLKEAEVRTSELDYTHLFKLEKGIHFGLPLEKEWSHVKIKYKEDLFDTSLIKAMGIHVVKEDSMSMEDIRCDDPYINSKQHNHLNTKLFSRKFEGTGMAGYPSNCLPSNFHTTNLVICKLPGLCIMSLGGSIPEWFDFQKRGPSISFWFRNEFPAKVLCQLIAPVGRPAPRPFYLVIRPMQFINGKKRGC